MNLGLLRRFCPMSLQPQIYVVEYTISFDTDWNWYIHCVFNKLSLQTSFDLHMTLRYVYHEDGEMSMLGIRRVVTFIWCTMYISYQTIDNICLFYHDQHELDKNI